MTARKELTDASVELRKSLQAEWDGLAKVSAALRGVTNGVFVRLSEAQKLSRALSYDSVPFGVDSIQGKISALASPKSDAELTALYEALIRSIDELPTQARQAAVTAFRSKVGE